MTKKTSFQTDIRPLFTDRDIRGMSKAFNLGSYDDVRKHASAIYDRIRGIGGAVMPPPPPIGEGPWPQSRVELFARWMTDGSLLSGFTTADERSTRICTERDGKYMPKATWKPHEKHGRLTAQSDLPDSVYAFPKQRKEPLTDAEHVRNAVARFDQVIGVSDADRALAFANIENAAKYYNVNLAETSWHDLGVHPQKNRREASAKGGARRERRARS